jgi:hypothetical protein
MTSEDKNISKCGFVTAHEGGLSLQSDRELIVNNNETRICECECV